MKQCLLIVAGLLAVVGCQRRTFVDPDDGLCTVRFQAASVTIEPESKADIVAPALPKGATVRVVAFLRKAADADLDNDTYKASCTYLVDDDGKLVPQLVDSDGDPIAGTAPEAIELNSGKYDFYAYTPARKLEADNITVKGIWHYQDFMGVCAADQSVSRTNSTVELKFEHKCAKITFSVKSLAGMTCDNLFADSVVLRKMGVTASAGYIIGDDIAQTVGTVDDSCVMRNFSYITPAQKKDGASGFEIVLPKGNATVPAEFYIKVNTTPYVMKATLPAMAFLQGNNYIFTVRVKQGEVQLTLKIASWNAVSQDNPNVGDDNGEILIGSWSNVDWSGSMGGNPDQVTAPIVIDSWTAVDLPANMGDANGTGGVGGWDDVNDNASIGIGRN